MLRRRILITLLIFSTTVLHSTQTRGSSRLMHCAIPSLPRGRGMYVDDWGVKYQGRGNMTMFRNGSSGSGSSGRIDLAKQKKGGSWTMDYGWFKTCGGLINVSEGVTAVCMSCLVVSHLCLLCLTYCRVDGYQDLGKQARRCWSFGVWF